MLYFAQAISILLNRLQKIFSNIQIIKYQVMNQHDRK